jgi:hypothetical protein
VNRLGELQLADVIILDGEPTVEAAVERTDATLAELPGCALVVVEVSGKGILLAARPRQKMLVPLGDVELIAVSAYESLLLDAGALLSRSASSAALGSPLAE